MTFIPDCMTPDEQALWHAANKLVSGQARAKRPCRDCPLSFAIAMRREGCCNGEPRESSTQANPVQVRRRKQWREAKRRQYARRLTPVTPEGGEPDAE